MAGGSEPARGDGGHLAETPAAPEAAALDPPATRRLRPAPRSEPSLLLPTAKAGLALAAITAAAAGVGALLGLPLPALDPERSSGPSLGASVAASPFVGAGTPPGLHKGPFHPVHGAYDYGDGGARFGAPRSGHVHQGQDLFARSGTPLVAVRDGIVVDGAGAFGRYASGRGNYLAIYSPADHRSYLYMHMLEPPQLRKGARVNAGQAIGRVGCTGSCWGSHLHFEVRAGSAAFGAKTRPIDPLPLLRRWQRAPRPGY
jgi:murein DD-endopeptidase MepM/ murein hydrolase activator NlpD